MIKINFRNVCLYVLLFVALGIVCVWYRHWEIEHFYSQSIKECLENPPEKNQSENSISDTGDKKMCDKECALESITTINTRLGFLERISDKHEEVIKSNTDNITKTSSDLKALQDVLNKAKKELEESTQNK